MIITLKHALNVSESKIHDFLENAGIFISPATISRILTKNIDAFHQEKADIFKAGLESTKTNYQALNERIEKTKENKSELLLTLKYPEIPLHNNDAEMGARIQVRKRDVSLHTMREEGTKASDTFLTIVQTAKKSLTFDCKDNF